MIFGSDGILGVDYGNQPYSSDLEKITLQHLLEQTDGFDSKLPEKCLKAYHNNQNELHKKKKFIYFDFNCYCLCLLDI